MIKVQTKKVFRIPAGTRVGLDQPQVKTRGDSLKQVGPDLFEVTKAVEFIAGEKFFLESVSPKQDGFVEIIEDGENFDPAILEVGAEEGDDEDFDPAILDVEEEQPAPKPKRQPRRSRKKAT